MATEHGTAGFFDDQWLAVSYGERQGWGGTFFVCTYDAGDRHHLCSVSRVEVWWQGPITLGRRTLRTKWGRDCVVEVVHLDVRLADYDEGWRKIGLRTQALYT